MSEKEQKTIENKNIVVDNINWEKKKRAIAEAGAEKLYVLADFDRTMTKAFSNGKPFPSLISILRNEGYLTPDYPEKAHALHDKYFPIEKNETIPLVERKKAMHDWWKQHFELLIASGLTRNDIDRAIKSSHLQLRDGVKEFIGRLETKNIPLVILSASGLGTEATELALKERGCLNNNVIVTGNSFVYDEAGRAVAVNEPIIHTLNKDEAELMRHEKTGKIIRQKTNVIVLGDSLSDADMADGLEHQTVMRIGFLNEPDEASLKRYGEKFDALICGDKNFSFINNLLKDLKI